LVRADAQDVEALAQIAQQVNFAWMRTPHALPESLDKIPGRKKHSVSGKSFVYRPKHDSTYELCAMFATDNRQRSDTNTGDFWLHPKGEYCFQLDASEPAPTAPYAPY